MELEEKDMLKEDVGNYEKIIDNKSTQIKLGEEKLLNKSLELASKDLEAKELEKGLSLSLDLTKKTEKENKDKIAIKSVVFGINSFCFYFIIL